jgi:crotonobetainyl-CoA:carnitine CoA-transferase CaiB-like acyl-CoA transferase
MSSNGSAIDARPLDGIRVLDLGNYIAGPGTAMVLGELGADVIKIEPLTGDIARSVGPLGLGMVRSYNRDKRSIALDLREPRGIAIVKRLMGRSDVFVQNMRPGLVGELGIGPGPMREANPRLIYVSISGFGMGGPSRDRPGLDIAAQAESGIMSVTGEADRPPQRVGFPIIDSATTHVAAQAILAALFKRERTGRGETIETSLLEVGIHLQASSWSEYAATGSEPTRRGSGQASAAPAAELIQTRDGWVVLSAYTQDHWARLCRTIGRTDLIGDARFETNAARVANRSALLLELHAALGAFAAEECVALLSRNQIVAAAVRSYSQVRRSADVEACGMFMPTTGADGLEALRLPYRLGTEAAVSGGIPAIGQHTLAILGEAGYDADEARAMLEAGVVATK